MKKLILSVGILLLLLSGCTKLEQNAQPATQESEAVDSAGSQADSPSVGESVHEELFDIKFCYKNHRYQYVLDAIWKDVSIKQKSTIAVAPLGTEILLDGSTELFLELDRDHSKTLSREEWTDLEADFPFDGMNGVCDGLMDMDEFGVFTAQLNGVKLYPQEHSLSQLKHKEYTITLKDKDGPVSLKILRAAEGGYQAGEGASFPETTVFIELQSGFEVHPTQNLEASLPPGFLRPLLSMYIEQDDKDNKRGALGFSSVVDSTAFSKIFDGQPFVLEYKGRGASSVMDEYRLTITPKN